MSSELLPSKAKLGECLSRVIDYRGKTPPKSISGIPALSAAHVKSGRIDLGGVTYVSRETYDNWTTRGFPEAGDVLITTEAPVGEVALLPSDQTYLLTRRIFSMGGKEGVLNNRFLLYTLLSEQIQNQLKEKERGSTVPRVLKPDILDLEITLPSITEQREVAHILGTLDDKIELNRKTNETLEGIAKALFKSWFVDFDPVKAKAEGRPTGLPDEISGLFPDSFEESELGEIPSGWTVEDLGSLANISGGKQLGEGKLKEKGSVPVYGANGVMGFNEEKNHIGFVIIFGRVGAYCGSVKWEYDGAWVNNNASSVVPGSNPEFVLRSMMEADYTNLRSGSAQPFISNSALSGSRILSPPTSLKDLYCQLSQPLLLKGKALSSQSETFALLRDALLPKLISGELRVPDAEKMLEEAGI